MIFLLSSPAEPVIRIILLFEAADNDALAGAGVYKLTVFEIDAHVCHSLAGRAAGEEYQISLAQVAAGDLFAFFQLPVCASGQTGVVNLSI